VYTDEICTVSGFSDEITRKISQKVKKKSFCYDLGMLLGRNIVITFRNKSVLIMGMIQNIIMGTLLSILFMNVT